MTRAIEGEKRKAEELENRLKAVRGGVMAERREMGGNNAPQEQNQAVQKQVKVLEHRLHRALVKFNEAIAANKDLREEIDNLRRERVVFDGIYKKLQHELGEKKRKMAEIIEIANVAYEARDRAQARRISALSRRIRLGADPRGHLDRYAARIAEIYISLCISQAEIQGLKLLAEKEQSEFETEWKELGHKLEEDRKRQVAEIIAEINSSMQDFLARERQRLTNSFLMTV